MAKMPMGQAEHDSGWQTLNSNIEYRKVGSVVEIKVSIPATITTTSWTELGVVPEGYRPHGYYYKLAYGNTGFAKFAIAYINAFGSIQAQGSLPSAIETNLVYTV